MPRTLIDERITPESIKPIQDHLLLQVIEREKTSGGILLPGNKATPIVLGKVLAKGTEIPNNYNGKGFPIRVEAGQHVIFMDYAGERVRVAWENYRLIREHGLWGVVIPGNADVHDFKSVKPWADRLILEMDSDEKTKSGLLFLPNKDMPVAFHTGTVVQAGFGLWHLESGKLLPCSCKPGNRVLFRRYAGAEITINGKTLRILQEDDILSIMEG